MTCGRSHVVITGASTGMGRAMAQTMARLGWHVFAGVRRAEDGEALRQETLTPVMLDVTDEGQIADAARQVAEHAGPAGLDALVNNAGIGVASPVELVPLADLRRQFEVNVIGQVAVTQAFLPLLRRVEGDGPGRRADRLPGRIVVIGSIGDRITLPFGGPLSASKYAIGSLTDALRRELAPWGIRVVLVEPASIHTEAVDKLHRDAERAADAFSPDGRELYRDAYLRMIGIAVEQERRGSPPQVVADLVAKVLSTPRPRTRYLAGKGSRVLATVAKLPAPAVDALLRRIFKLPKSLRPSSGGAPPTGHSGPSRPVRPTSSDAGGGGSC